jgi:ribosomal protein L17
MPFQPGNTEHQKADRGKKRVIAQHIVAALNEAAGEGDVTKMRKLVDKLIAKALEGDVQAMKEVIDRVDGKVPTPLVGDDEHDAVKVLQQIEYVVTYPDRREATD